MEEEKEERKGNDKERKEKRKEKTASMPHPTQKQSELRVLPGH